MSVGPSFAEVHHALHHGTEVGLWEAVMAFIVPFRRVAAQPMEINEGAFIDRPPSLDVAGTRSQQLSCVSSTNDGLELALSIGVDEIGNLLSENVDAPKGFDITHRVA